jgi:phage-related holin
MILKTITLFLASVLTFLIPIQGMIFLVLSFVALDTYFGIRAVVKITGWKHVRSGVFFNIAPKLLFYIGCIILLFMVDTFIFGGILFNVTNLLSKSISMIWIFNEAQSINENRMKLGKKNIITMAKDMLTFAKTIKKDINQIK